MPSRKRASFDPLKSGWGFKNGYLLVRIRIRYEGGASKQSHFPSEKSMMPKLWARAGEWVGMGVRKRGKLRAR